MTTRVVIKTQFELNENNQSYIYEQREYMGTWQIQILSYEES